jgi:hypothetical protein
MPAGRERPALSGLPVGDSQLSPPRREQATPAPHRCRRLRSLFATWPVAADDGVDLAAVDGLLFQHEAHQPIERFSVGGQQVGRPLFGLATNCRRTTCSGPRCSSWPYAPRWGRGNRGSWAGQLRSRKISCSAARPPRPVAPRAQGCTRIQPIASTHFGRGVVPGLVSQRGQRMIKTPGRTIWPQQVQRVSVGASLVSWLGLSVGASARRLSRHQSTHAAIPSPLGIPANAMPIRISDMMLM